LNQNPGETASTFVQHELRVVPALGEGRRRERNDIRQPDVVSFLGNRLAGR